VPDAHDVTTHGILAALCVLVAVLLGGDGVSGRRLSRLRCGPRPLAAGGWAARPRRPRGLTPRRRTRAGQERAPDPALVLELVAAAMATGAHPSGALAVVGEAVDGAGGPRLRLVADRLRLGATGDTAWAGAGPGTDDLRSCLALSARTGAPASQLLRDRAEDVRRRRHRTAQAAAQRLGVRVVLPLGLCALPGFAAWGVVPVVLGLAADVLTQ
jgi:hypothetical protein